MGEIIITQASSSILREHGIIVPTQSVLSQAFFFRAALAISLEAGKTLSISMPCSLY
jgi:hypothetical protein